MIRDALADAGVDAGATSATSRRTAPARRSAIRSRSRRSARCSAPGAPAERPLLIGSVKTNIGHLEAAAGIAGLIKVVLALQHGEIPPHLHFETPNPHIAWDAAAARRARRGDAVAAGRRPRIAGVSSFGFSGTNAHVVLEEAPRRRRRRRRRRGRATVAHAVGAHADALRDWRPHAAAVTCDATPTLSLADVCFTPSTGRAAARASAGVVADARRRRAPRSAPLAAGETPPEAIARARAAPSRRRESRFLFTGQGAQYRAWAASSYESRAGVPRGARPLRRAAARRARRGRCSTCCIRRRARRSPLDETAYTQPALFALEYALAELWRSWGVDPAAVLGHSVGEYVAAVRRRRVLARGRRSRWSPRAAA